MGKYCHDDAHDALLNYIVNNCDRMYLCTINTESGGIPDHTMVLAANLITDPLDGDGDGVLMSSGDFTLADGDVSGRKITVSEQANKDVDTSGDAVHIALTDDGNTKVLYQTVCTTQSLSSGSQVTIPAWDIENRDPV